MSEHCNRNPLQSSARPEKGAGRKTVLAMYTSVEAGFAEALSSGCVGFIAVLVKPSVRIVTGGRGK